VEIGHAEDDYIVGRDLPSLGPGHAGHAQRKINFHLELINTFQAGAMLQLQLRKLGKQKNVFK
jgi:hypothetical protein